MLSANEADGFLWWDTFGELAPGLAGREGLRLPCGDCSAPPFCNPSFFNMRCVRKY